MANGERLGLEGFGSSDLKLGKRFGTVEGFFFFLGGGGMPISSQKAGLISGSQLSPR